MAKINGIVGRFSGIVSYEDQSWESFHAQIEDPEFENGISWSQLVSESSEALSNVYGDTDKKEDISNMFLNLPFVSNFYWEGNTTGTKKINGVAAHLYVIMTLDDGRNYPATVIYEKGVITPYLPLADIISDSDDLGSALSEIESFLELIMKVVTIS